MSEKRAECFTVYIQRAIILVVERFYSDRRSATKTAKRVYKKTRRRTWVKNDDGKILCTFGR